MCDFVAPRQENSTCESALIENPSKQRRVRTILVAVALCATARPGGAEESRALPANAIAAELRSFVLPGTRPIAIERGDLNGDGREDIVLVLERQKARPGDDDIEQNQRPMLILVRQADGSLKLAGRNDAVAHCATCGGMMGDPFVGVEVGTRTFTVSNYGGSAWRWSVDYRFDYSRRDDTWQLVRVAESSFHASDPNKAKNKVSRPPKDFGKIDFADFDPEKFVGQGKR